MQDGVAIFPSYSVALFPLRAQSVLRAGSCLVRRLPGGWVTSSESHARFSLCACSLSRVLLFATPWTVAHQAPLSLGFSRQEYWSGLPFPTPGDPPDPGIEPTSSVSPALVGGFFITEPPGKSYLRPCCALLSHSVGSDSLRPHGL